MRKLVHAIALLLALGLAAPVLAGPLDDAHYAEWMCNWLGGELR